MGVPGCPIPQNTPFLPISLPTVKKTRGIFGGIYSQIASSTRLARKKSVVTHADEYELVPTVTFRPLLEHTPANQRKDVLTCLLAMTNHDDLTPTL